MRHKAAAPSGPEEAICVRLFLAHITEGLGSTLLHPHERGGAGTQGAEPPDGQRWLFCSGGSLTQSSVSKPALSLLIKYP